MHFPIFDELQPWFSRIWWKLTAVIQGAEITIPAGNFGILDHFLKLVRQNLWRQNRKSEALTSRWSFLARGKKSDAKIPLSENFKKCPNVPELPHFPLPVDGEAANLLRTCWRHSMTCRDVANKSATSRCNGGKQHDTTDTTCYGFATGKLV